MPRVSLPKFHFHRPPEQQQPPSQQQAPGEAAGSNTEAAVSDHPAVEDVLQRDKSIRQNSAYVRKLEVTLQELTTRHKEIVSELENKSAALKGLKRDAPYSERAAVSNAIQRLQWDQKRVFHSRQTVLDELKALYKAARQDPNAIANRLVTQLHGLDCELEDAQWQLCTVHASREWGGRVGSHPVTCRADSEDGGFDQALQTFAKQHADVEALRSSGWTEEAEGAGRRAAQSHRFAMDRFILDASNIVKALESRQTELAEECAAECTPMQRAAAPIPLERFVIRSVLGLMEMAVSQLFSDSKAPTQRIDSLKQHVQALRPFLEADTDEARVDCARAYLLERRAALQAQLDLAQNCIRCQWPVGSKFDVHALNLLVDKDALDNYCLGMHEQRGRLVKDQAFAHEILSHGKERLANIDLCLQYADQVIAQRRVPSAPVLMEARPAQDPALPADEAVGPVAPDRSLFDSLHVQLDGVLTQWCYSQPKEERGQLVVAKARITIGLEDNRRVILDGDMPRLAELQSLLHVARIDYTVAGSPGPVVIHVASSSTESKA